MSRRAWPRPASIQILVPILLLALAGILESCGGNASSITGPPVPNVAGAWEFVALSGDGSVTGIEVALKEGQVLVNGVMVPNGQITASSTQIAFVNLASVSGYLNAIGFGGNCQPFSTANGLGPGTVIAPSSPINFTFTENGYGFTAGGTLSGDDQSVLNGTYTAQAGNTCADPGGTFVGSTVPKLAGTFVGKMCPLGTNPCGQNFTDNATATLSESSSGTGTLSLVLSGTDNTTFTMTGPVTGNAFSVEGTFQGQVLTYYGYFEKLGSKGGAAALYLVNATNPAQQLAVGTLAMPPNP